MTDKINVSFDLALGAEGVRVSMNVEAGPIPARRLLPLFRGLTNSVVDAAVGEVGKRGEHVSCKAGCGACCRQLVAISGAEAQALRALVDAMPEPRRSEVRARFEAALTRLDAEGMLEAVRDIDAVPEAEGLAVTHRYMALRIPCPLLEDESCSIHPQRPLVCREYLVTTPADRCVDPSQGTVRTVPLRALVSRAVVGLEMKDGRSRRIPLVMALSWAEEHASDEPERRQAMRWIDEVLRAMTGKTLGEGGAT
ncbi:MAG TPA: YkgJ family cysteine cluster protein [Polyangiaceae bacterium]|jgi:Fe-S-cluster containining protein